MSRVLARVIPNDNSKGHLEMLYKPNDFDMIYNKIMRMTDNNHGISEDAASWCELATIGEIYEFNNGIIKIENIS